AARHTNNAIAPTDADRFEGIWARPFSGSERGHCFATDGPQEIGVFQAERKSEIDLDRRPDEPWGHDGDRLRPGSAGDERRVVRKYGARIQRIVDVEGDHRPRSAVL